MRTSEAAKCVAHVLQLLCFVAEVSRGVEAERQRYKKIFRGEVDPGEGARDDALRLRREPKYRWPQVLVPP